jgi:hypothetical protein
MTMTTGGRRSLAIAYMALVIAIIPLLGGCEDIASADDIPYVERIVVRGKLEVWKPVDSILLTRTLPLGVSYDPADAAITDADATITADGVTHRLLHIGAGFYHAPDLIVQPGRSYTLNVSSNGKKVTATTLAPLPLSIDTLTVEKAKVNTYYGLDYVLVPTVVFRPRGQQVYLLSYTVEGRRTTNAFPLQSDQHIVRASDTGTDGRIHLRGEVPEYSPFGDIDTLLTVTARLHAFDYPFYDYYQTTRNGGGNDDIFLFSFSGGNTIRWNVSGDGFGMFIATWSADFVQ